MKYKSIFARTLWTYYIVFSVFIVFISPHNSLFVDIYCWFEREIRKHTHTLLPSYYCCRCRHHSVLCFNIQYFLLLLIEYIGQLFVIFERSRSRQNVVVCERHRGRAHAFACICARWSNLLTLYFPYLTVKTMSTKKNFLRFLLIYVFHSVLFGCFFLGLFVLSSESSTLAKDACMKYYPHSFWNRL